MAASYAVTLERGADGTYLAWVDDLPGCAVRAASREEVLERLPGAIREFLAWAGEPDEPAPEVDVIEEVESAIEADEDTEVLVTADRSPLTLDDWTRMERYLARSRAALLDLLGRLGDEQLAASPTTRGPSVAGRARTPAAGAGGAAARGGRRGARRARGRRPA